MSNDIQTFQSFVDAFLADYYEFYPSYASALGLHQYDGRLPDLSASALENRIRALRGWLARLEEIPSPLLTETGLPGIGLQSGLGEEPGVRAEARHWLDRQVLRYAIENELFQLDELRDWQRNPLFYLSMIDTSRYIKRNYAPLIERARGVIAQQRQTPAFLETARRNLSRVPRPFLNEVLPMLDGAIAYLQDELPAALATVDDAETQRAFAESNALALEAVKGFAAALRDLLPQAPPDFAIGEAYYRRMLSTGEALDVPLDRLLAVGEADLARNKARFEEAAARLAPGRPPAEVMRMIAREHPAPADLIPATRATLDELRDFVIARDLVSVPYDEMPIVAETPRFMRYAFAMIDWPGLFETVAKETYYYVTPPEADWPPEQVEEWMTKFDYHTLRDVSIHEAWPGHFLNYLHWKNTPSQVGRVFGSYAFVEGWAHYSEHMMLEQGYGSGDLKLLLGHLSEALLRDVRYICAIAMHTQDMTLEQATQRFMDDAYMERLPAYREALRGTYDPGYLNYTLGKLMLLKLRQDVQAEAGSSFSLKSFHDALLAYGAPPIPLLRQVLLRQPGREVL